MSNGWHFFHLVVPIEGKFLFVFFIMTGLHEWVEFYVDLITFSAYDKLFFRKYKWTI